MICQVLYFAEKILDENLVVFRGSFPSPIDLAPSISTSKVCGVSLVYYLYSGEVGRLFLYEISDDFIGLTAPLVTYCRPTCGE